VAQSIAQEEGRHVQEEEEVKALRCYTRGGGTQARTYNNETMRRLTLPRPNRGNMDASPSEIMKEELDILDLSMMVCH